MLEQPFCVNINNRVYKQTKEVLKHVNRDIDAGKFIRC